MTPDVKLSGRSTENGDAEGDQDPANKSDLLDDEEDFFDFITRFQSKRMDDQRCSLAVPGMFGAHMVNCIITFNLCK